MLAAPFRTGVPVVPVGLGVPSPPEASPLMAARRAAWVSLAEGAAAEVPVDPVFEPVVTPVLTGVELADATAPLPPEVSAEPDVLGLLAALAFILGGTPSNST